MNEQLDSRFLKARRRYIAQEFSQLNDMQQEAVLTTEGPLLLLAGAGSGKTTVLINRIANIMRFGRGSDSNEIPESVTKEDVAFLETLGDAPNEYDRWRADNLCAVEPAAPWSIIAITFTNKAANELKDRLSTLLGPEAQDIWAMTFHSACCRILRRDIERMVEKIALRQAVDALPEREKMVVQLRYFHGLTQQRVAKVMDVSQVQVSRIEKKALTMLRELME